MSDMETETADAAHVTVPVAAVKAYAEAITTCTAAAMPACALSILS